MRETKTTIESVRNRLKEQDFKDILVKYKVRRIALFGSYATGEPRKRSDIDFLVEFERGADLFDQVGLKLDLEDFLGKSVDVVTASAVSPYLRDKVIQGAVYL